jgi:hypothetical protein
MNCAEAVNSTLILWKSCENRSGTNSSLKQKKKRGIGVDPRKSVAKQFRKNKCGTGQPPVPHRSWISRLAFPLLEATVGRY